MINNYYALLASKDEDLLTEEEKELKELLSRPSLKDMPYKLIFDNEVPLTPLMKVFLMTFEFCRHRYVNNDIQGLFDWYFDDDKFQFLLRHEFGIEVNQESQWTMESMKALMLRVESETTPEYRERLMEKWEDFVSKGIVCAHLFIVALMTLAGLGVVYTLL